MQLSQSSRSAPISGQTGGPVRDKALINNDNDMQRSVGRKSSLLFLWVILFDLQCVCVFFKPFKLLDATGFDICTENAAISTTISNRQTNSKFRLEY